MLVVEQHHQHRDTHIMTATSATISTPPPTSNSILPASSSSVVDTNASCHKEDIESQVSQVISQILSMVELTCSQKEQTANNINNIDSNTTTTTTTTTINQTTTTTNNNNTTNNTSPIINNTTVTNTITSSSNNNNDFDLSDKNENEQTQAVKNQSTDYENQHTKAVGDNGVHDNNYKHTNNITQCESESKLLKDDPDLYANHMDIADETNQLDNDRSLTNHNISNNSNESNDGKSIKRKRSRASLLVSPGPSQASVDGDTDAGGRSKRRRTQTQLFQAGDSKSTEDQPSTDDTNDTPIKTTKPIKSRKRTKSTNSQSDDQTIIQSQESSFRGLQYSQDVIYYEKNDFLAIRNEHDTFYLGQLTHTVRSARPTMTVRWLDTNDDGKTYYLTLQQDKIPQQSVIMPVDLMKLKSEKKGEQLFSLEDDAKDQIIDRLKRSLIVNAPDASAGSK